MLANFAILDFGMPELIIILAIVLVLFGGKKLPEVSKALGQSMKEIRKGLSDVEDTKKDFSRQLTNPGQAMDISRPVAATQQSQPENNQVG